MSKDEISEYAFEMEKEERNWKHQKLISYSLPTTLRGYAKIFELYDQLYEYCKKKNVKLYNCAHETLIQGIPKKSFQSVFNENVLL